MKRYDADLSVCQWVCGVCVGTLTCRLCAFVCVCVLVAFCLGPNLCGLICVYLQLASKIPNAEPAIGADSSHGGHHGPLDESKEISWQEKLLGPRLVWVYVLELLC
jgi:hypothetical protein